MVPIHIREPCHGASPPKWAGSFSFFRIDVEQDDDKNDQESLKKYADYLLLIAHCLYILHAIGNCPLCYTITMFFTKTIKKTILLN